MGWQVIIYVILGLLACDFLVRLFFAIIILPTFERKPPFGVEPVSPHPDAEHIKFPTDRGLTLQGSLYRHEDQPSRGLIIFCPELGGTHWSVMSYCEGLWNAGFDLLAFDFRNQGQSESMPDYEPIHWLTDFEVQDVHSAIAYVKSREDLRELPLGLMGISRGGSAALAAAAGCPDVKCVACEGSFATNDLFFHFALRWASIYVPGWLLKMVPIWHLRGTLALIRHLSQWHRKCHYTLLERCASQLRNKPILMIAGERDSYVAPAIPEQFCRRVSPNAECLWVVPNAKHNGARKVEPEEYDRRLVKFFSQLTLETPRRQISQSQPQTGG